jgi:adenosylcobinamide-GDP ribazoletransferase
MGVSLLVALQFLTVIPVRVTGEVTPRIMGRAMAWFPTVGLMLGATLAVVDLGLRALLPPAVSAALLLALWVMVTGALHLDGLMDCCDGLLAAREPEKRLEIMRDTHVGAFAVAGAACLLLVKFAVLLEMPAGGRLAALVVVPVLSRAAMVYAARAYPYARPGPGLGRLFRDGLTWRAVVAAALTALVAAVLALGWPGLALVGLVWLMTVVIAWWVQRRIPGLTGDVYGAINELTELGGLLVLLLIERAA